MEKIHINWENNTFSSFLITTITYKRGVYTCLALQMLKSDQALTHSFPVSRRLSYGTYFLSCSCRKHSSASYDVIIRNAAQCDVEIVNIFHSMSEGCWVLLCFSWKLKILRSSSMSLLQLWREYVGAQFEWYACSLLISLSYRYVANHIGF